MSRRVLVTGGANGIGLATVERLVADGATVAVLDAAPFDPPAPARAWTADVAVEDDVERAVAEAATWMGGIDVLVHAAGVMQAQGAALDDVAAETWDHVLAVNLRGAFLVAKAAARAMVPGAAILLVGSSAGITGVSGSLPYAASKGGLHALALNLASRLEPQGIRVNEVCPGLVDTPLLRRSMAEGKASGGGRDAFYDQMAERLTPPAAVADVIAFLASPAGDVVRGTVFTA